MADLSRVNLFQWGEFRLHSGEVNQFKIECDALQDEDWDTLAHLVVDRVPRFRHVVGILSGGEKFASALVPHCSNVGCILIVDDVFTTGASMAEMRKTICIMENDPDLWVVGAAVFARNPTPDWIFPIFSM